VLAADGIGAEVVHLASIADRPRTRRCQRRPDRCAVTAENATINGGFGAAVLEVLGESARCHCGASGARSLGRQRRHQELFTHHGMQPEDIAAAARRA
jgi:transketolase C-terminal domain/subunit